MSPGAGSCLCHSKVVKVAAAHEWLGRGIAQVALAGMELPGVGLLRQLLGAAGSPSGLPIGAIGRPIALHVWLMRHSA